MDIKDFERAGKEFFKRFYVEWWIDPLEDGTGWIMRAKDAENNTYDIMRVKLGERELLGPHVFEEMARRTLFIDGSGIDLSTAEEVEERQTKKIDAIVKEAVREMYELKCWVDGRRVSMMPSKVEESGIAIRDHRRVQAQPDIAALSCQ